METRLQLVETSHDDATPAEAPGDQIRFVAPERRSPRSWRERVRSKAAQAHVEDEGAVTAEYAIVIMAAVAFAGLLVAILRSAEIRAMLVQLVEDALGAAG